MFKPHLRYCINPQCAIKDTIVEYNKRGKSCGHCGAKTTYYGPIEGFSRVGQHDDRPPATITKTIGPSRQLLEGEPDPTSKPGQPLTFTSDCDLTGCPLVTAGPRVRVPFTLWQKWVYLAKMLDVEWIANLTGTKAEDGTITLDADGMSFPNQIATGATVKAEYLAQSKPENVIACVHSHVSMTAHFSTTDYENFNSDVELVVNDRGAVDCVTRLKLKCGEYQRVQSKVDIIDAGDLTKCLRDLQSKLTVHTKPSSRELPAHYAKQGPSAQPNSDLTCRHGINYKLVCTKCREASVSGDENPSDKAVRMALRIIDRRIKHEGNVDLRTLLDSQATG